MSDQDHPFETRAQLKIWHPDCWTLQVTEDAAGGLIAGGVYTVGTDVMAHVTVHGDTIAAVDEFETVVDDSPLTSKVWAMEKNQVYGRSAQTSSNATRDLLVSYEPSNSIHEALVNRGFIPNEPIRVRDGFEYWTVMVEANRPDMSHMLGEIERTMNAEIDVRSIETVTGPQRPGSNRHDALSERQREVYELARERGYYRWPRDVSVKELAVDLNISKATVLEHLRKAEAKLLG